MNEAQPPNSEPRPSRLYRMIEDRLPGTLAEYMAEQRPDKSWREMATDLENRTGIFVSHEALRSWFADRITVETRVTVSDASNRGAA